MSNNDILSMLKRGSKPVGKVTKPKVIRSGSEAVVRTKFEEDISKTITHQSFPLRWQVNGTHLIKNVPANIYCHTWTNSSDKLVKIAAFDLDGTLINTKSGSKFARSPDDWKWWAPKNSESKVIRKLNELVSEKYIIVILTNQGGVVVSNSSKSYLNFIKRVNSIVDNIKKNIDDKDTEVFVFASPKKPSPKNKSVRASSDEMHNLMRKPNVGMWNELKDYFMENGGYEIDNSKSFYVGDAAGRVGDFSDSDKLFAKNIDIQNFKVPEEFFV